MENQDKIKEVLFNHFLESETKKRNEAIELLKKKEFSTLRRNYVHYTIQKAKIIKINEGLTLNQLNEKIGKLKLLDNQSEYRLYSCLYSYIDKDKEYNETRIYLSSYVYTIENETLCINLANIMTKNILFKLEKQKNAKELDVYKKLLNKHNLL